MGMELVLMNSKFLAVNIIYVSPWFKGTVADYKLTPDEKTLDVKIETNEEGQSRAIVNNKSGETKIVSLTISFKEDTT